MSEQALVTVAPEPDTEDLQIHLAARNTQEMSLAKQELHAWLTAKIRSCRHDFNELEEARKIAVERKWASTALRNQAANAKNRLKFYGKVLTAVNAGYTIVPNFPVDLFAIRVEKGKPVSKTYTKTSEYSGFGVKPVAPLSLPEGVGRYVDDNLRGQHIEYPEVDAKGNKLTRYYFKTTAYGDMAFPLACARPVVMNATAEAMALKVFDAIGICPNRTKREDPLIIGQVRRKRTGWQGDQIISFLIAWHLDLRTI